MIVKACDGYVNVLKYDSSDVLFGIKWIVYLQMAWHPPGRVIVIYIFWALLLQYKQSWISIVIRRELFRNIPDGHMAQW